MKSEKELLYELTWQMDFIIRRLFPEEQDKYDDMLSELQEELDSSKQGGVSLK